MIHPAWTHRTAEPDSAPLGDDTREALLVRRALRIIATDACSGLRVEQLANRLGVSRRCLAKWFPRVVCCSPSEAIHRAVFDEVEHLLLTTDLRLAEIAARTGFRHTEYFTVAFARRYGMPPREWRERRRTTP